MLWEFELIVPYTCEAESKEKAWQEARVKE